MPEEMRDPKSRNIPGSDRLPFRFRIHRLPEDWEGVTCEEKEEQLLRQLRERGPQDEDTLWQLACVYCRMNRQDDAHSLSIILTNATQGLGIPSRLIPVYREKAVFP